MIDLVSPVQHGKLLDISSFLNSVFILCFHFVLGMGWFGTAPVFLFSHVKACWFLNAEQGEGLQVLQYKESEKYEAHYDYFHDAFNTKNGGQRIATVLMYL